MGTERGFKMKKNITEIPEIVRLGRTAVSRAKGEASPALSAFWTASGIELTLKASMLSVEVESIYDTLEIWADVMIDGELSQRVWLPRGRSMIHVFTGLDGTRKRTVRILKDTQAMAGDKTVVLRFHSLETDDAAEFIKPEESSLRLEIIGDSITSGEGAGLENQVEWAPLVFSAVNSYGYLTAELLNARVNILSSSGWGLYASWDAHTECALPLYYDEVCGLSGGMKGENPDSAEQDITNDDSTYGSQESWEFESYRPDFIVINLGTNDSGAITAGSDKWTREEYHLFFTDTAVKFLKKLRDRNPGAYLLWAYGMLGNDMADWIREAISSYRGETGDERVSYFEFANCGEDLLGARSHPGRRAHREAAEELAAEIKNFLKKPLDK